MGEDTVVSLPRPGGVVEDDPLLCLLREGARQMLMQAIQAEVDVFVEGHADLVDDQGRKRIVRKGKIVVEDTGFAESRKSFPDSVPVSEPSRQRTPGDVVNREIMKRFQEQQVVPRLGTSRRKTSSERFQRNLPIRIRHLCRHHRPSLSRSPMNHANFLL